MITIGCDPEIFLVDAANAFKSAIDKIGGSKHDPRPLEIGDGFAVQEDNVALEFNIPPAHNAAQLDEHIEKIMQFLSAEVQQQGLAFSRASAVSFPKEELMHPRAMEFGCDPDFNAWRNGAVNPRPRATNTELRTCGGHVHVGYKFARREDVINFVKYMDLFLGVPSVLLDEGEERKQLYGKPGAFRYKPFGMEYRVLSNFWIFSKELRTWVWNSTEAAMKAWQSNKINMSEIGDQIQAAISNNDKALSQQLLETYVNA